MKKSEVKKWKEMNDKFIKNSRFRKIYDEFETKIYYDIVTNEIKRKEYCADCDGVVCCLCFESLEIAIDTVHEQRSLCGKCLIVDGVFAGNIYAREEFISLIGESRAKELNVVYKNLRDKKDDAPLRNALDTLTDKEIRIIISGYEEFFEADEEWIGETCNIGVK